MRDRLLWTAAVMALVGGVNPAAQAPVAPPVFSARVDTVRVDVLVSRGREVIRGLGAEDFELLDNGVVQQIDWIGFDEVPVNVMLALDMSGSVRGARLEQLRRAATSLSAALARDDTAALIGFSERVILRSGFTPDRHVFETLLREPIAGGDTALIDAVHAAMVMSDDQAGRPLVIVFSDGADTASFLSADQVLGAARRLRPAVYAVTSPDADGGGFLNDLATATGGRRLNVDSLDRLSETFTAVLRESKERYLLSYTPTGVDAEGWHELVVRVPGRDNVEVSARPGYFAGP